MKHFLFVLVQSILISSIVIIAVFPISCNATSNTIEGIQIFTGDFSAPEIQSFTVVNSKVIQMRFSEPVNIFCAVVSEQVETVFDSNEHSVTQELSKSLANAGGSYGKINTTVEICDDGKLVNFVLEEPSKIGVGYELYAQVQDEIGNSLTFCAPFTGFNDRIPKIIITEAQIKYAKATLSKGTEFRAEFIELLALTDGNLCGLELYSAADTEEKAFVFSPIEVKAGQIILVHPRIAGEGCICETENNLDEATGYNCVAGILDLWDDNTTARYNDSSDVILLKNVLNNSILDAVFYVSDDVTELKPSVLDGAKLAFETGIYEGYEVFNACSSNGTTPKKSITRVDANIFLQEALSGKDIEYPVSVNSESWQVLPFTPGTVLVTSAK